MNIPEAIANTVFILDGGAQYGMDIEQMVKSAGVYARRVPLETPIEELVGAGAIIISGGPNSVFDEMAPRCDPRLLEPGANLSPRLGTCYGMQLINHSLGGTVESLTKREDGPTSITVDPSSPLFDGLEPEQEVLMSHGDTVVELAPGFVATAHSGELIAAIANEKEGIYGVQFHPEVYTPHGSDIIGNFIFKIAGLTPEYVYSTEQIVEDAIAEVREQVGDRQVLAFVSGGVDSSALGVLLEKALPKEQVSLVYVDSGLMRKDETEEVKAMLHEAGVDVHVFDAKHLFLEATTIIDGKETLPLNQVTDPEIKRKIIGDTFIKVQDQMAADLGLNLDDFMLAMGTLHTDLIESGSKHASDKANVIKSHHNDTQAVRELREAGRVLEPWRFLQKDQVRAVAKELGLPEAIFNRQPFPGPGLGIRILCAEEPYWPADSNECVAALAQFDTDEIKTQLLPIRTVGVQGDHRTYGHLVALSGAADWPKLIEMARAIPRDVHGVNRVAYVFGEPVRADMSSPDAITRTYVNEESIEQLQEADAIVRDILKQAGLDETLSQVPVVSFPVNFGKPGQRSIGIRTFMTTNFKTGDIAVPGKDISEKVLQEIVDKVLEIPGIARVVYDLTSKPPGTTEWE